MSDESDGKRDLVSKSQGGSTSMNSLFTSSSGRKSSKKEKSSDSGATTDASGSKRAADELSRERKSERSSSGTSRTELGPSTDPKNASSRESKSKKLKEELAAANAEIARLRFENEDLREQLETLQSVISVQNEQRALTKKQQRRQKQKQQSGSATDVAVALEDSDEEEFDEQETEMFDKAASSDDTQVKRKLQEHKRTRSNQMASSAAAQALVDAELPPKKRSSDAESRSSSSRSPLSPTSSRKETTPDDSPTPDAKAQQAPGTAPPARSARPTRPTNGTIPPRKAKFATATNLSRTFISQEDEKELVGGSSSTKGDTEARGRLMTNFALVSGEVNLHSLKIGVLGTPDPNAPKSPSSSNNDNDHPHIFDENTVLDILCGLGITSSRQFDDSPDGSVLIPRDFSYSYQFKVRRMQDQLLKFKDFAPKVFHQIRKVFNVSESELLFSFRYDNLDAFKGAGKSGAFFIFSKDKRFILKTATKEERDFLWELLPYYLLYIRKHPNTLLPRFFGVYSMKHEGIGGVVRFVIMNNWFATFNEMKEKYDLKGSTVGRTVGSELNDEQKAKTILKDLDIKRKIYLPDQLYKTFMDQLKQDAAFLAEHNVMDYSLLVGMSDDEEAQALATAAGATDASSSSVPTSPVKSKNDARRRNMVDSSFKNVFQQYQHGTSSLSADSAEREIAYFGIIDVLQQYNTKKKLEHLIKSVRYEGDNISIVQPSYYAKRFIDFISSKFGPESEAAKLIAERNATAVASEEKEEKKEKRRSNKDRSAKKLKLSVPAKDKEKEGSKTPITSDDEGDAESSRSKRSNTIY